MGKFIMLAGPIALIFAGAAAAQAPTQSHQQHQASGQHQAAAATETRCCCEEMMHKMMMEMMEKHQSMGATKSGTEASAADPAKPTSEHKH